MNNSSEVYRYDPATDSWKETASKAGGEGNDIVSFVIGDKAYMGLGYINNYSKSFYQFKANSFKTYKS